MHGVPPIRGLSIEFTSLNAPETRTGENNRIFSRIYQGKKCAFIPLLHKFFNLGKIRCDSHLLFIDLKQLTDVLFHKGPPMSPIRLAVKPRIFSLIISSESPIIPADLRNKGVQEQTGIGDA